MSQIITCTRKIYKNHKPVAVSLRWRVTSQMKVDHPTSEHTFPIAGDLKVQGHGIAYFGIRMNRAGTTFGNVGYICTSRILEQSMESQRWTLTEEDDDVCPGCGESYTHVEGVDCG